MAMSTTHPPTAAEQSQAPPDLETMRAAARQLLGPDAAPNVLPPSSPEVDTLTLQLRGHLELLAPEVEHAAGPRPKNVTQYCALACVGEARGKLRAKPGPGAHGGIIYARRLARVLRALCDHYERLGGRP